MELIVGCRNKKELNSIAIMAKLSWIL